MIYERDRKMRTNRFWKGFLSITMMLAIALSLGACGKANPESYEEEINKEIARMIADGELIDVVAEEEFDKQAAAIIEESDIGSVFEEEPMEVAESEKPQKAPIPEFVESNGPDTIQVDDYTYDKIGVKYQPGEYVIVADEGQSAYYAIIKDDEEHTIVANGGNESYEVFDTLDGQYITVIDGKIYPIDEAPEVKKTESGGYPEGIYKVGVQIPAGEYVARGDSVSLTTYVGLSEEDSSMGFASNIRSAIIKVEDGEYLECTWGEFYPLEMTADLTPTDGIYKDGMYKVGFHMPAGTYILKADAESAYAEIFNDGYQIGRGDEVATAEPETTFTVKDGQYVSIMGGEAKAQ